MSGMIGLDHRRRVRRLGSCAAVAALAVIAAGCTSQPSSTSGPAEGATPSAASPSASPSTRPTAVPSPGPKGVRLVVSLGSPVVAVTTGDDAVYAIYLPSPNGNQQVVIRLDPRTGGTTMSPSFPGAGNGDGLAFLGGSVWATGGIPSTAGRAFLYQLDAATLAVIDHIDLPGPPSTIAAGPAGLWVGAGRFLILLDPSDGRVLRSLQVKGEVGHLAVDPTGRLLYVSTHLPADLTPLAITERDATSGAVLVSVPGPIGLAVNRLSATTTGVWVSYATGTLGSVVLLRASDLHLVASFRGGGGEAGSNDVSAEVAGGILWVPNALGGVWCADPATGRLRGREMFGERGGLDHEVAVPPFIYAGAYKGLVRITPSPSCG